MEFGNEYDPGHNLEWIIQLIVLNMDVIVDEMWFWISAEYIIDILGSPNIGETLKKIKKIIIYAPSTLYRGED